MRIGELAERTGVSRRSLRYYEEHGLIRARRTTSGWRSYDEQAEHRVAKISALLDRGLTIEAIKRLEPCLRLQDLSDCDDPSIAIETHQERIAVLDERLGRLRYQHEQLTSALRDLHEGAGADAEPASAAPRSSRSRG